MKTLTYCIPNVTCEHCLARIRIALGTLPGVDFVESDLPTKTIKVEGTKELSDEFIRAKLAEIGYPAQD